jgi:2-iminobutanoate/2-iminopropanoate deaminase
MKKISTQNASKPSGHYSQAIVNDGIVYVSGQLPVDPNRTENIVGSIEEQMTQVLSNLDAILIAANSSKDNVLKVTVFLTDILFWDKVNAVFANYFGNHRPARVIISIKELHFGYQVEMDAIAKVNNN